MALIQNICHLADLHCRKFKRHDEYRKVFKTLYKSLEKNQVDRIVLAGDIVHNKNDLSPELVQIISELFTNLSKIAPLDIIIGNHDKIIGQSTKLDSISPITDYLNLENLTLYKNSGLFEVADNLVYGIFAIDDEENFPYQISNKNSNKTYIALFHGAISGAKTDVNYTIKSNYETDMFTNYDIAMLGDIHKFQDLSTNKTKINFVGSLIQQSFGENLSQHGYLLWNIQNKSYKFIKIKNDYGFYTIRFNKINEIDEFYSNILSDIPKHPHIRVLLNKEKQDIIDIKNLSTFIKEKYNPISLFIEVERDVEKENKIQIKHIANITDFNIQQEMLKNYLIEKQISQDEIEKVLFQHKIVYNKLINYDLNIYKGISWDIHSMKFSNTFSYGKNNVINFDQLGGLVGIFSPNQNGKSSIVGSLLNGFFNESNRVSRNNISDIVNHNEKEALIQIEFSLGKRKFLLKRIITKNEKNSNKARNNIKLYEYIDNRLEDLSGEANINNTEKMIRSLVGDYDDHSMTCFGEQNDLFNFIDLNQSARKDRLSSFLGLKIFDEMFRICKDENNEVKSLLKQYRNNDYDGTYNELNNQLIDLTKQIKELNMLKEELEFESNSSNKRIIELSSTLQKIENNLNIEELELQKNSTEKRIKQLNEEINQQQKFVEKAKDELEKNEISVESFSDVDKLSKSTELYEKIKNELDNLNNKRQLQNKDLHHHSKLSNTLELHDWFENSELCKKCTFLSEAFKSKNSINQINLEVSQITETIFKRKEQLKILENFKKDYAEYERLLSQKEKLHSIKENYTLKLELLKRDLINSQDTLESIRKSIKKYEQNKDSIELNKSIRKEIKELEKDIKYYKEKLDDIVKQLYSRNVELGSAEQKILDIRELVNKIYELNEKNKINEILQNCLYKDGIPLSIIKTIIPHINSEIRKILSNVVNFDVMLEIDEESNDLMIYLNDSIKRKISLCSGMEKTIASIAIRASLANVSLLPKSSLFIIDEGFSALDSENLNSINLLLGTLKEQFKSVIIISHVIGMNDITDHIVSIEKNQKNYSKIFIE